MRNRLLLLLIGLIAAIPTAVGSACFAKMIAAAFDMSGSTSHLALAMRWYKRAADMGDVEASRILGNHLFIGDAGETEVGLAAVYWRRAAENGDIQAQGSLGDAYCLGIGVERDPVKARQWWQSAASQGYVHAIDNLKNGPCATPHSRPPLGDETGA